MFSLFRPSLVRSTFQPIRTLLTSSQIGLDRYLKFKEERAIPEKEKFISDIKKSLENDGPILIDDLKQLVMAVDTIEDGQILKEAFIKFANKNSVIVSGFRIGPIVSRAFYSLNDLNTLEELFKNEQTFNYLKLRKSYAVFLNLLYKNGKYSEILDYFEKHFNEVLNDQNATSLDGRDVPLDNEFIVYLAAANKLGTKEAFERVKAITKSFIDHINKTNKRKLLLKQILLYHLLCSKAGEHGEALETISAVDTRFNESLNAKAVCLIRLNKTKECLETINKILENNSSEQKYVYTETIEIIKNQLEKNPNEELKEKIDSLSQENILDAKIEDSILSLPNAERFRRPNVNRQFNRFDNRQPNRFDNRYGGRFENRTDNRFRNRYDNRFENRFENRFDDRFDRRNDGFNRRSNYNSRFNDDQNQRTFKPFQTTFKEDANDII